MGDRQEKLTRRMRCPYCGYECNTQSIGAVHCGPHYASMGPNMYPAVRMVEVGATDDDITDLSPRVHVGRGG